MGLERKLSVALNRSDFWPIRIPWLGTGKREGLTSGL